MKFRKRQLEQAIRDGKVEIQAGEIKHQHIVEVRNIDTGKVFIGYVEEEFGREEE